jgi:hypothetical protein
LINAMMCQITVDRASTPRHRTGIEIGSAVHVGLVRSGVIE